MQVSPCSLLSTLVQRSLSARSQTGRFWAGCALGFLALSAFHSPAYAQEGGAEEAARPADEEREDDKYLALIGGDIFTGTGAVLRGANLLIKNGKIREIGYDFYIPEKAERKDVRGFRLYPGLVALSATSRITQGTLAAEDPDLFLDPNRPAEDLDGVNQDWVDDWAEDDSSGESTDAGEATTAVAEESKDKPKKPEPAKNTIDDFDPFSQFMTLTLAAGITTVEQSDMAVKLRRFKIEDVLMATGASTGLSWSGAESRRKLREDFTRASGYLRSFREWEAKNDKSLPEPSKKGLNATVLRVLKGEVRAKFSLNERDELLSLARFAQEFGFRPLIDGAAEAWTVADELGRAGATVILTPRSRRSADDLLNAEDGSTIENSALLHRAGVQIAVQASSGAIDLGGIAGRDLLALPIEAGFAVRGGLSDTAALQAITIVPARILGVDHRVGTLEVGKDADILVTDGDILHYETFVQWALVLGEIVYDKQEELFYAHIRPRAEEQSSTPAEGAEATTPPDAETPETPTGEAKAGQG